MMEAGDPEVPAPHQTKTPVRTCLLFLSHHIEPGAMAALETLRLTHGHAIDVFPVFDQTRRRNSVAHVEGALEVTCADTVAALPYKRRHAEHPGTFWPKNIDLPLMWFFQKYPEYDYYWVMEYDVRFTGNWKEFFRHFDGNQSDLLATTIYDHDFRPGWRHWRTLKSPMQISLKQRTRALFPLYRLSRAALAVLHQAYRNGWSGHYEVLIPTILKLKKLSLEDLGGGGSYVKAGNINRFYTNSPRNEGLAPGTFTVFPNSIKQGGPLSAPELWHPIKG